MLLLQALPAVVCAVPELPVRVPRLGVVELRGFVPVRARRLHGGEVGVRVAVDVGFRVEALFVRFGVVGALFGVAEVGGHGGVEVAEGMGLAETVVALCKCLYGFENIMRMGMRVFISVNGGWPNPSVRS